MDIFVKKHLAELVWHNLPKIQKMYKSTLEVDFPDVQEELMRAIHVRHDLVHRAGKDKKGNVVVVSDEMVRQLAENTRTFLNSVQSQLEL